MKDFIIAVVKALVDSPDEVQVTENITDGRAVYELRVAQSDLGKVIGKRGQTAQSLRTLMSAIAARHGKRVALEIMD